MYNRIHSNLWDQNLHQGCRKPVQRKKTWIYCLTSFWDLLWKISTCISTRTQRQNYQQNSCFISVHLKSRNTWSVWSSPVKCTSFPLFSIDTTCVFGNFTTMFKPSSRDFAVWTALPWNKDINYMTMSRQNQHVCLRPAWIQTSLRIRAVWLGSMLSAYQPYYK
jgi:hypothetical protein